MPQYRVRSGDTLWNLSKKFLGSGSKWRDLGYKGDPRKMGVGTLLSWGGGKKKAPPKKSRGLAGGYAQTGVKSAPKGPVFSEVMPYHKAWGSLQPMAMQAAAAQVNPEAIRQYRSAARDLATGMARSGGGRFGRARGQFGGLQAAAERQRQAQLQDWRGTYEKGFRELFYDPTEQAWTKAMTLGKKQEAPNIPTWAEFAAQYGQQTGQAPPTGVDSTISPFIGTGGLY